MFKRHWCACVLIITGSIVVGFSTTAFSQEGAPANEPPELGTAPSADEVLALRTLHANEPIDGVTAMAILLIGSFLVDRVSTGALKFLGLSQWWRNWFPDPAGIPDSDPERESKARIRLVVMYHLFAALVAIGLIAYFGKVKLFNALGFGEINPYLDQVLTGLMMVVGAERVAQWLNLPGTPGVSEPQPIKIMGDLMLKEASRLLDEVTDTEPAETE